MGSIVQRLGKYRGVIRKKGKEFYATFSDKESAEIWVRYKEDLIDQIEAFSFPPENMVTLLEVIEMKEKDMIEKKSDTHSVNDIKMLKTVFLEICDIFVCKITVEMLENISNVMLNSVTRRGGNASTNTGKVVKISPITVLRKFRILATVFSFLISKGANMVNPAQVIVNKLKIK